MPTTPTPYVHPNVLTFYLNETPQTESFCVFNPFPQDILFKVDNACPEKYAVSLTQGVVSSRNKIFVSLTCTSRVTTQEDGVQVRFFKWAKPRQGHKSHAQQYVGFREIKIRVFKDRSERERTPSDKESVSVSPQSLSGGGPDKTNTGSIASGYPMSDAGSSISTGAAHVGRRTHVITNFFLAVFLLVCGFTLNQTSEPWFSANIIEGVKPQTLAIVSYTLAIVVIIKLLTLR